MQQSEGSRRLPPGMFFGKTWLRHNRIQVIGRGRMRRKQPVDVGVFGQSGIHQVDAEEKIKNACVLRRNHIMKNDLHVNGLPLGRLTPPVCRAGIPQRYTHVFWRCQREPITRPTTKRCSIFHGRTAMIHDGTGCRSQDLLIYQARWSGLRGDSRTVYGIHALRRPLFSRVPRCRYFPF